MHGEQKAKPTDLRDVQEDKGAAGLGVSWQDGQPLGGLGGQLGGRQAEAETFQCKERPVPGPGAQAFAEHGVVSRGREGPGNAGIRSGHPGNCGGRGSHCGGLSSSLGDVA